MDKIQIGWFIGLAASSIILFLGYFLFSSMNYKKRFKDKYDARNHFPYEFNYESRLTDNIFGNIALLLSMTFSVGLFALGLSYFKTNGYMLIAVIIGVLYSILVIVINFIPLKTIKTHLAFAVILFVLAFIAPATNGLTAFNIYQQTKLTYPFVVMIISFVVALFMFALVMNPKLSLNIKMNVATDEKGNEYYVRPKYIAIAFTEWMMCFAILVNQLLFILVIVALL